MFFRRWEKKFLPVFAGWFRHCNKFLFLRIALEIELSQIKSIQNLRVGKFLRIASVRIKVAPDYRESTIYGKFFLLLNNFRAELKIKIPYSKN